MKKQTFAILSIAAFLANKSYGQFTSNPPTITPNTSITATGGNVGIGIAAPAVKLQVHSASATQFRLSAATTIYTDFREYSTGIFLITPTANGGGLGKIGFGSTGVDAGVGFQSSMGRFRMKDLASTTRGLDVVPSMASISNIPGGTLLTSIVTTSGEGLSLSTNNAGEAGVKLGAYAYSGTNWNSIWETQNEASSNPNLLLVKNGGKVLIGDPSTVTLPAGYKLFVQEGILTEKVKVALVNTTDWADYVFAKDYKLKPLHEVADYIAANKHLPGIGSAEELKEQGGFDVAKMDAKLLEKIEELTLYIIEQNKKIETLQNEMKELKKN